MILKKMKRDFRRKNLHRLDEIKKQKEHESLLLSIKDINEFFKNKYK
jgi:hypothetical protein